MAACSAVVTVLEKFALRHPPTFVSGDTCSPDNAPEFSLEMFGRSDHGKRHVLPRTSTPGGMHDRGWGQSTKWSPQKKFSSARLRALADTSDMAGHATIFEGGAGKSTGRPLASEHGGGGPAHPESPSTAAPVAVPREHLIATKALRCTATAWMLIVAQCSAIP